MIRSNHYEAAFEAYLRQHRIAFLSVDEARRSLLDGGDVKSLDFVIVGPRSAKLVVDVKGRKFPGGSENHPRKIWQNWIEHENIDAMTRWAAHFGPEFRGVLAFVYEVAPRYALPDGTPDLFPFRGRLYLMRAIDIADYREHMRPRSRRWRTVDLPSAMFRQLVQPFSVFLDTTPQSEAESREDSKISP